MQIYSSASEAVQHVQSGSRIFIHGMAATPLHLIDALINRAEKNQLMDLEVLHLHTIGPAKYANPEYSKIFKVTNFFLGANMRSKINYQNVDYLPCFLSEIPQIIR